VVLLARRSSMKWFSALSLTASLLLLGCEGSGIPVDAEELAVRAPAGTCDGGRFPTINPVESCCEEVNRTWHMPGGGRLAYRVYGDPCREADGVGTQCGAGSDPFVPCVYGPCGARNVWVLHAEEIHVFRPVSNPDKCGWHAEGITSCQSFEGDECEWENQGSRSFPEPYDGQEGYEGTTPSCPYRRCLVGGIPAL
jgi:hypothetical protein